MKKSAGRLAAADRTGPLPPRDGVGSTFRKALEITHAEHHLISCDVDCTKGIVCNPPLPPIFKLSKNYLRGFGECEGEITSF